MSATPTQMNLRRSPRRSTQTRTVNALSKVPLGSLRKGDRRSLGTLNRPGAAPRLTPTKASVASPLGGKENSCQDGEEDGKPFAATEPSDNNLLTSFQSASEDSDNDSEDSLEHPPFDSSLSGNYRSVSSSDGSLASCADSGTVKKKGVDVSTQAYYPSVPTEIKVEAMESVDDGSVGLNDDADALGVDFRALGDGGAKSGDEASVVLAVVKVEEVGGTLGAEFQTASDAGGDGGSKNELEEDRVEGVPFIPANVKVEGEDSSSLQEDDVIICPGLWDQLEEERKSLRQYQNLYANASYANSAKDAVIKQRTEERDTANDAVKGMKEQLAATDIQRNAYKAKNELLNVKLGQASARAEEAEKKLYRRDAELAECKSAHERQIKTLKTVLKEESKAEVVAERMQGRAREEALTKQLAQSNADKKKLRAEVDAVRAQRDEERNRARDSEKAWADKLAKSNAGLIKYQSDNEKLKLAVDAERNNGRVREKAWEVERERSNSELQRANAKLKTDRIEASKFQRTIDEKNRLAASKSALEKKMWNARALALAMGCLLILVCISWLMERAAVVGRALADWFGV